MTISILLLAISIIITTIHSYRLGKRIDRLEKNMDYLKETVSEKDDDFCEFRRESLANFNALLGYLNLEVKKVPTLGKEPIGSGLFGTVWGDAIIYETKVSKKEEDKKAKKK